MAKAADNELVLKIPAGSGQLTLTVYGEGFASTAHVCIKAGQAIEGDSDSSIGYDAKSSTIVLKQKAEDDRTVTLEVGGNKVTGLSFSGPITSFDASAVTETSLIHDNLTSLSFSQNAGLTTLILKNSSNQCVFPYLTSLVANKNNLTAIPGMNNFTSMTKAGYQIGEQAPANLTEINNTDTDTKIASNEALELTADKILIGSTKIINADQKLVTYTNWRTKDKNGQFTVNANNLAHASDPATYRFYFYEVKNGVNYFIGDTEFLCDAVMSAESTSYPGVIIKNVPVHVDGAKFKLKLTTDPASGAGSVTVKNGERSVANDGVVKSGDQLVLTVSPAANYTAQQPKTLHLTTTAVANTYSVDGSGDPEIKVVFVGEDQPITYTPSVEGGTVAVKSVQADKPIAATNGVAPFGSEIEIIPTPSLGYKVQTITFNGTSVNKNTEGKYIATVVKGTNKIVCNFEKTTTTYTISYNRVTSNLFFTCTNGATFKSGDRDGSSVMTEAENLTHYVYEATAGATLEFKLAYKPTTDDGKRVSKVLLDGTPMTLSPITVDGATQAFLASATMPDHDVTIMVETTTLTTISMNVETTQTVVFNGAKQLPAYSVTPNLKDLQPWYKSGSSDYTKGSPVNVGTYTVKFTREEDTQYAAFTSSEVSFTISPADPKIETVPTYSVAKNTTTGKYYYAVSTQGKATFNGQTLTGKFTIDGVTDNLVPEGKQTASHTIAVTFQAQTKEGGADNNYNTVNLTANAYVSGSAIKEYTVTIGKLGDATLKLYNGTKLLIEGEGKSAKVAEGTILTAEMTKPGYQTANLRVISVDDMGAEIAGEAPSYEPASPAQYTTFKVDKNLKLGVKTAGTKQEFTSELSLKTGDIVVNYDGKPHILELSGLQLESKVIATGAISTITVGSASANFQKAISIRYLQGTSEVMQPTDAGIYTAVVKYDPEQAGHTSIYKPFEGSLTITIKKISAPLISLTYTGDIIDQVKATPIAKGQPLSQSKLTGSTKVEGHYEWVDEKHVPSSIDATKATSTEYKYQVKFVPADTRNYNEVVLDGYVAVEVSDKAIVTFAPKYGTIKVVDSKNKEYVSGEEVAKDTRLTITATPDVGYEFESMTINGTKTTNKVATYTMGEQSLAIEAVFAKHVNREIVAFSATNGTVTVTRVSDGYVYRSNEVVEVGTQLSVSVMPYSGFKLKSLKINNSTYTSAPQVFYFTGTTTISAVCEKESPDKVVLTFPTEESVFGKGFMLNLYGTMSKKYDEEVKLSVYTLLEDAKNIIVKAGTTVIQPNKDGTYTIKADADKTIYVALAKAPTPLKVSIETETKNAKGYRMGTVQVVPAYTLRALTPTYYYGDKVTLIAYPESGVSFAYWSDSRTNKSNIRTITLTKDIDIKPVFTGVPTDVESIESAEVIGGDDCIIIRGVANARVTIVSMEGRSQQQMVNGDTRIQVRAGVYGVILEQGKAVIREKIVVR